MLPPFPVSAASQHLLTFTSLRKMRLLTWNLRFDSQTDDISVKETLESLPDPLTAPKFMGRKREQPWSSRRIRVAQEIRGSGVSVIGITQSAPWPAKR